MKTWFDEKRIEMLNKACEQVLSPQVQGPLSFADVIQIAGLLESHNNEAVTRNTAADLAQHDVDVGSEQRQAMIAEVVANFDNKTIGNFTWGAEKEHVMDLSEDGGIAPPKPAYVGDRLSAIQVKVKKITDYFPDDGESFILCTPLIISVLQSAATSVFVSTADENPFRGPNYIMLIGELNKVPIYSYLSEYKFGADPNDEELIIIGNYQKGKDNATTQRLIVKNLSLA